MPEDRAHDLDCMVDLIDWEANADRNFSRNHFLKPQPMRPVKEMAIRFGQMISDELFVSLDAGRQGIIIASASSGQDLVMLMRFGPRGEG